MTVELGNGETYSYRDFNTSKKDVLILLHGNATDHTAYDRALAHPALANLRQIAVDMRGFGRSTYNKPFDSLADLADDLALFCEKLAITRPIFIGWSTGGGVAMQVAIRHPLLSRAVLLLESIAMDGLQFRVRGPDFAPVHPPRYYVTREELAKQAAIPIYSEDPSIAHRVWSGVFQAGKIPPIDSAAFKRVHRGALLQREQCRADTCWALASYNVVPVQTPLSLPSHALRSVRCPVALLHGRDDAIINHDHAAAFVTLINRECWAPNAPTFKLYSMSCGHMPPFDDIDEFTSTLAKAIAELPVE